jgi:hypothetical protein
MQHGPYATFFVAIQTHAAWRRWLVIVPPSEQWTRCRQCSCPSRQSRSRSMSSWRRGRSCSRAHSRTDTSSSTPSCSASTCSSPSVMSSTHGSKLISYSRDLQASLSRSSVVITFSWSSSCGTTPVAMGSKASCKGTGRRNWGEGRALGAKCHFGSLTCGAHVADGKQRSDDQDGGGGWSTLGAREMN